MILGERLFTFGDDDRVSAGVVTLRGGLTGSRGAAAAVVTDRRDNRRDSDSWVVTHWVPVARAMCDRLVALDGLVPPAAVARSTPSSPSAYRAAGPQQQQQLEKTASVPDLQQKTGERAPSDGPEQHAAPASACGADSKSDGCLTETCRPPVTSLSGTFLTPTKVSENRACGTNNSPPQRRRHYFQIILQNQFIWTLAALAKTAVWNY